jgi:hypothetical protein
MYCVFEKNKNHKFFQKRFGHKLSLLESPGTISRTGGEGGGKNTPQIHGNISE